MLLRQTLAAYRQARETAEIREAYRDFLKRLDAAQVGAQALSAGQSMPSFILPNAEGRLVASDELLAQGPLVITFFRGGWCPYCAMTLEALETALPDLREAHATLVALTPETGGLALATKRRHQLGYEVLVDVDLAVAMQFGVVFRVPPLYAALLARHGVDLEARTGNAAWFLPIPAAFLVDRSGIVQRSWVDIDFTHRAEPMEILESIRAINRR